MKRTLAFLAAVPVLALLTSGCATLNRLTHQEQEKPAITKRFYAGSIIYIVDTDAQVIVSKLITLQGKTNTLAEIDGEVDHRSDRLTLPLYRETDLDRDHHITKREAESFYLEYVRQFEDQVGDVIYQ